MKRLLILILVTVSTSSSQILFNGTMESGTLQGYRPEGNDSSALGTTISTDVARVGTYSMKSYLNRLTSPIDYRTMVYARDTDTTAWSEPTNTTFYFEYHTPYWISLSVYIPYTFVQDDLHNEIIWQMKGQPDAGEEYTNPPFALQIDGADWVIYRRYSDDVPTVKYVWDAVDTIHVPLGSSIGGWTDWTFHFEMSWTSNGWSAVYKNGVLVDSVAGPIGERNDAAFYTTFGVYKWDWADGAYPPYPVDAMTVYIDEFKIGDSTAVLADVAPAAEPPPPPPGGYYVAKTGSNSNPGTYASPWLTINYGCTQLASGDTLIILEGTYTADPLVIQRTQGGTSGDWTVIRTYDDDSVTISSPGRAGIYIREADYVAVYGKFGVYNATFRNLNVIGGSTYRPDHIYLEGVHCYTSESALASNDYYVNAMIGDTTATTLAAQTAHRATVKDCYFSTINYTPSGYGEHDVFLIAQYDTVYMESVEAEKYTHYFTVMNCKHGYFKDMHIHNAHSVGPSFRGSDCRYHVVDGGRFYHSKNDSAFTEAARRAGGYQQTGAKNWVVRFAMFYDDTVSWSSNLDNLVSTSCVDGNLSDSVVTGVYAHNVCYGRYDYGMNKVDIDSAWSLFGETVLTTEAGYSTVRWMTYRNNIFAFTRHSSVTGWNTLIDLRNMSFTSPTDFEHHWDGNCFWDGPSPPTALINYTWSGGGRSGTVGDMRYYYPTLWGPNNKTVYPVFVDSATQGYYRNFALDSTSTLIAAAVPIDTVAANVSGTRIYVKRNVAAFCDGFGVTTGDSIQIGSTVTKVTAISYTGNYMDVANSVIASAGTGIWYYRDGMKVDDIGPAIQYVYVAPIPSKRYFMNMYRR